MSRTQELRQAFERGAMWREDNLHLTSGAATPAAAKAYPTPVKTIAREVVLGDGTKYRIVGGVIQVSWPGGAWHLSSTFVLNEERLSILVRGVLPAHVAKILDLIDNPTETVEVYE